MRAPSISNEIGIQVWNARANGEEPNLPDGAIDYIGDSELTFTELELVELSDQLDEIRLTYGEKDKKKYGGEIDGAIVSVVHRSLTEYLADFHLARLGFWRWLSNVALNGAFWQFIMWRLDSTAQINWGLTSQAQIVEVYFYRAWLRGHKMHDPDLANPYEYAERGSSDFWRSHVLRVEFGKDREFVKAFLDVVEGRANGKRVGTSELRKALIPALRAWSSSAAFCHLSYQENIELIMRLRSQSI